MSTSSEAPPVVAGALTKMETVDQQKIDFTPLPVFEDIAQTALPYLDGWLSPKDTKLIERNASLIKNWTYGKNGEIIYIATSFVGVFDKRSKKSASYGNLSNYRQSSNLLPKLTGSLVGTAWDLHGNTLNRSAYIDIKSTRGGSGCKISGGGNQDANYFIKSDVKRNLSLTKNWTYGKNGEIVYLVTGFQGAFDKRPPGVSPSSHGAYSGTRSSCSNFGGSGPSGSSSPGNYRTNDDENEIEARGLEYADSQDNDGDMPSSDDPEEQKSESDVSTEEDIRRDFNEFDVEAAFKWASNYTNEIEHYIYGKILTCLDGKSPYLIQMIGLGPIDENETVTEGVTSRIAGPVQLAVAIKLHHRFKQQFQFNWISSQEPRHMAAEKNFLKKIGVDVYERDDFGCSEFTEKFLFQRPEAAFIAYMIHGTAQMFESFLQNHWSWDILSRFIFIGSNPHAYEEEYERVKAFAQYCHPIELAFEKDSLADQCFDYTWIYKISENDAKTLIDEYVE